MNGHVVVMAKPVVEGRVKTRLIDPYTARQAARVHAGMLECVLERTDRFLATPRELRPVLAIDQSLFPTGSGLSRQRVGVEVSRRWELIDQGTGDLGERMTRLWETLGGGAVVFLGVDIPDLPVAWLDGIIPSLRSGRICVGPVEDGGYWTLAGGALDRGVLTGIDWGTSKVYDQTVLAAGRTGGGFVRLPSWYDVDTPSDLIGLRQRLEATDESALVRLRETLDRISEGRS